MKLTFDKSGDACPEQYDVFDEDGNNVAYVRLRHGTLTVSEAPLHNEFYRHSFDEGWKGAFDNDAEAQVFLGIIERQIRQHYGWDGT